MLTKIIFLTKKYLRGISEVDNVVNVLYKISDEMNGILNGCGSFGENLFYAKGKIFDNWKETEDFYNSNKKESWWEQYDKDGDSIGLWRNEDEGETEFEIIDCRYEQVDIQVKKYIYHRICLNINEFYKNSDKDEFLLALGFSINLYYIVGLYQTFGKFDVNKILNFIDLEEVKEYGNLINEFLYSRIVENIKDYIIMAGCEVDEVLNYAKNMDFEEIHKTINSRYKNYIPDIYMLVKEGDYNRKSVDYLEKMVTIYPKFRFGWIYRCLNEGLGFYITNGENIEVYKFEDKLGKELFGHIIGLKDLETGKSWIENNELKFTSSPSSDFGIGIPRIKAVSKWNFYSNLSTPDSVVDDHMTKISLASIRKMTSNALGVDTITLMEENPLLYVGKSAYANERLNRELKIRNNELLRIKEQRRKMIDQLAHSWGNECYPEIVRNVAIELNKNGESSLANKLFKAYHSEKDLMGGIIYLQVAMEDEPEKLKNIFSDSFLISGKGNKEWKIQSVIEESLENLVFSLLNYKGDKEKRNICKKKLCVKFSLEELTEDYSKRFEDADSTETESFIQWFSYKVFPVKIKSDEVWDAINFGNTEYGKIVMKNIFTELFTNVLFHGKTMCEVLLESIEDKMYIKVSNEVAEKTVGQRKGLTSLKEMISKLNYGTSVSEEEGLKYDMKTDKIYETTVVFAKELMFIDEEW